MKKVLFLLVVMAMASGCVRSVGGRNVVFYQRGIALSIIHTCTNRAFVYDGQAVVADMLGATPKELVVQAPFSIFDNNRSRRVSIQAQSLNSDGEIVGTYIEQFNIDSGQFQQTWYIGDDNVRSTKRTRCQR